MAKLPGNSRLILLIGPELVLGCQTLLLFRFCARHGDGQPADVDLMEKLVWLLPFVFVPGAFATIWVPGSKSWWWLGRAMITTLAMLVVCGGRIVQGFGSGARGQDAALLIILILGSASVALAGAISGTMILIARRPEFGRWFRERPVLGSMLTALTAIPVSILLGLGVMIVFGAFVFGSTLITP